MRAKYPEDYGERLTSVHPRFSNWLEDNSQAKLVVLFGAANATRFLKRFHNQFWSVQWEEKPLVQAESLYLAATSGIRC
jgi:hypothetical protein